MNAKKILPALLMLPLALIQLTLIPYIRVLGSGPDLVLILLVVLTLVNGQIYGALAGFIFGFIFDLMGGGLTGLFMFSYTLAGFTAGYFFNKNSGFEWNNKGLFSVVIFTSSFVSSLVSGLLSADVFRINIMVFLFEYGILPAFYSSITALIFIIFFPPKTREN